MNYTIMHRDKAIAFADENGISEIIIPELCPACFAPGMPLHIWLDNRCIDVHRSHSRKLFKALRLRNPDDLNEVIGIGHGISITDNWWIRKTDENLDSRSLKEYNEEIADIAFYGSSESDSGNRKGYLEFGTVGSYEKAWRFIDGSWYMFKQGSTQELLSEYYSYQFLKHMNANVAEYEMHNKISEETGIRSSYIVTKDFTGNADTDFEPFCNYFHDHDEPEYIIPRLEKDLVKPYVMMVFYDVLLHNDDRHNQNAGVLRDSETGKITGLAPYFDYNLALISTGVPRIDDVRGNLFTDSILSNNVCCDILKRELPDRGLIIQSTEAAEAETSAVFDYITPNYGLINDYIIRTYDFLAKSLKIK